nr:BrnT family toxin [uncultured Devosia sp.]
MRLSFDPAKRDVTLAERGLDFAAAAEIFAGRTYDREDDRFDYGEVRMITVGHMAGRMVVVVWTQRGDTRHIISMRKANEREQARYTRFLA